MKMPVWIDRPKQEILENNGYAYDFFRMIYVNFADKKVFSFEAIDDHDTEWLKARIAKPNETDQWIFNFNAPTEPDAIEELEQYLEDTLRGTNEESG